MMTTLRSSRKDPAPQCRSPFIPLPLQRPPARLIRATAGITLALAISCPSAVSAECETLGTVRSQHQIGQFIGGFGAGLDLGDWFGIAVADIGDVDQDGVRDLAVGAPRDDDGGPGRGAIWILLMNPNDTVKTTQKISSTDGGFGSGLANGDGFGSAIAPVGDLDGNGFTDLAVGARYSSNGGAVWILFMGPGGTVSSKLKIANGSGGFGSGIAAGDEFGVSVASVGDFDADGVGDIAVGAHLSDDGGFNRGSIWIILLNANGSVRSKQKISHTQGGLGGGLANEDYFGTGIALVGDLDGDGIVDLATGAHFADDGGPNWGAVWILFLNGDGTVKGTQKISATDGGFGAGSDGAHFGVQLGSLPDLDGDGLSDLAVGASGTSDGGPRRGAFWILGLNADGTVRSKLKISQTSGGFAGGLLNSGYFGRSVAFLGGEDQDGNLRLIVGASAEGSDQLNAGEVWIVALDTCSQAPVIVDHPDSILISAGGEAVSFSVSAVGSGKLRYQWLRDGQPLSDGEAISGAQTPVLSIDATATHIGIYECSVSSRFGSTFCWPAVLGIRPSCIGDFNSDGIVNGADLGTLLGQWGPCIE